MLETNLNQKSMGTNLSFYGIMIRVLKWTNSKLKDVIMNKKVALASRSILIIRMTTVLLLYFLQFVTSCTLQNIYCR